MKKPIYLDYMATTPVDPRVIEAMIPYLGPKGMFGNPASTSHGYGLEAAQAIDQARSEVASLVQAQTQDIVFTSGATESNNLAILGAAHFYQSKGRHVITMATEHKSVLDSFAELARQGFAVTYLLPEPDGLLSLEKLAAALRKDTILVSIMQVNNETGVVQDIPAIAALLDGKGIIFHVDAAQSAGKIPIDLSHLPLHLMSFSAHKMYGPKGVGALYVRRKPRTRLQAQSYGGSQEGGLRAGTLPTHQVVGLGAAFALAKTELLSEQERLLGLRQRLWEGIKHLPGIHQNGHPTKRIAGNLNVSFEGLKQEDLLIALKDLALSSVSACAAASREPSYVLRAMGLPAALAHSALRISFGRFTTEHEIERAIALICQQVQALQP